MPHFEHVAKSNVPFTIRETTDDGRDETGAATTDLLRFKDKNGNLVASVQKDGTITGIGSSLTGIAGGSGAPTIAFTQSTPSIAGATSISVAGVLPANIFSYNTIVVVGVGTSGAEIRRVNTASASTLSFTAPLVNAHSTNEVIIFLGRPAVTPAMWGAKGDGSDDYLPIQNALDAISDSGTNVDLDGINLQYWISSPVFTFGSASMKNLVLRPTSSPAYGPIDATNAMLVSCQDLPRKFTALASNDTFTTVANHNIGGAGNYVAFRGTSLPTGIIQGRIYQVKTVTSNTLTVNPCTVTVGASSLNSATVNVGDTTGWSSSGTATINGISVTYSGKTQTSLTGCGNHAAYQGGESVSAPNTLDLTSDGSGTVYCDINATERLFLENVTIEGNLVSGINGISNQCQQPQIWRKVRVNNCAVGVQIAGQDGEFDNLEIIGCTVGLLAPSSLGRIVGQSASMMKIRDLNCEGSTTAACQFFGIFDWLIDGYHGEGNSCNFKCTAGVLNVTWINPHISYLAGQTSPGWEMNGGSNATAYQIIGHKPYGASGTDKIINDLQKGVSLTPQQLNDFNYTAGTIGAFVQKGGPNFGVLLDNTPSVLSVRSSTPGLGSIGANSSAAFNVTVPGAAIGQVIVITPELDPGNSFVWRPRLNGADTVEIRVFNVTSSPATPTDCNWQVRTFL